MIIDAHAHLSNTGYGNANLYFSQLAEANIDYGIAVPGGMLDVRRMTDYIIGKCGPDNPIPDNAYVQDSCKKYQGALSALICINPHDPNTLDVLESGFKAGFKGLKLSPMTHEFSFAAKAVSSLAACCGDYGYPVYSHVLYSPGASTTRFVALARQFPATNFILGHMGFGPADQEGLEAAVELDNFFLETSTGNFLHICEAVAKAGAGKVIFGSEFPLSHPKAELQKILLLKLPEEEIDKILAGNIQALLHLKIGG